MVPNTSPGYHRHACGDHAWLSLPGLVSAWFTCIPMHLQVSFVTLGARHQYTTQGHLAPCGQPLGPTAHQVHACGQGLHQANIINRMMMTDFVTNGPTSCTCRMVCEVTCFFWLLPALLGRHSCMLSDSAGPSLLFATGTECAPLSCTLVVGH